MFIKAAGLKSLMKEAWGRGILFVSRQGDELIIYGGSWIWWGRIDTIPNKVKAALIELTGELPDDGISFKAGKDQENQYEFTETIPWDRVKCLVGTYDSETAMEIAETKVLLESKDGRIFRTYRNNTEIVQIAAVYSGYVSNKEIMPDRENMVEGPFVAKFTDIEARVIYWCNATSIMICFEVISDDWRKDFMENMKTQVIEESRRIS